MSKDFISIEEAYKTILNGGVGVLPTDTLYGLVAKANNADAVSRLYKLKDRENKPGTVIAQNIDQLVELGLKRRYLQAVNKYWPGSVSVVIPTGPNLPYLHQGKFSLAVRIPNDPNLTKLLSVTGPLLTTSANAPGKPPATNIDEAKQYFGNKVDFWISKYSTTWHFKRGQPIALDYATYFNAFRDYLYSYQLWIRTSF